MIALKNSHKTFGLLGSFWNTELSQPTSRKARWLAEAAGQNTLTDTILQGSNRLTALRPELKQHRPLHVPVTSVSQIASSPRPTWRIAFSEDIEPVTIQTKLGVRVQGVDFTVGEGELLWFESPYDLFDLPVVQVLTYREFPVSLWNYSLRLNSRAADPAEVTRYYRIKQDPAQFQRAIAAAAGYTVLPFTSILRAVQGSRYVFDAGVLEARYQHAALETGKLYTEGTIIGDMVRVHTAETQGEDWYRNLDWTQGMALDDLTQFPGLRVPDEQRRVAATTESETHPGKYHVVAQLDIKEQSGSTLVPMGYGALTVRFEKAFASAPIIIGSPQAGDTGELSAVSFVIHAVSVFGFTVTFSSTTSESYYFHWKAASLDDSHGQTTIPSGADRVRVVFPVEQTSVPVIAGCIQTDATDTLEIISHLVSLPDTTGFDVLLSNAPSSALTFNWQILTPQTGVSRELIPADTQELTVTFADEYDSLPLLLHGLQNASPDTAELIPYVVTNFTITGFTVKLSSPTSSDCFFHWAASTDWHNVHARFWQHQAAMEDITGVFLSDALGISGAGSTGVNLLDMYFTYLLGTRGMIVDLKENIDSGPYIERAERFARSEKPLSAALVIRHT